MKRALPPAGRSDWSVFAQSCLRCCAELSPGAALDIPGGSGRHSLQLVARGMTVICADIDFLRLQRLREVQKASSIRGLYCVQMNAQRPLPFTARRFDLLVVVHYYEPGFLAEAVKLLKPAGRLIFETFGAQGGNWIGLPQPGALAAELEATCDLLVYNERPVRSRPEKVTAKVFAQRLLTDRR